jgi:hypothetical protein
MTIMKLKTGCDTSLVGGATESLTFFWGSTVLFSVFSSSPLFFFSYHLILHSSSAACPLPRRAAPMIVETYARTGEKFGLEGWGC